MEPFVRLIQNEKIEQRNKWKPSRYNIQATDDDGSLLLSNTFSGAFVNIPQKMVSDVKELLKSGYEGDLEGLSQKLVERGFLIQDDVNELFRARMLHEVVGRKSDSLQLIFLASEQCNFRCVYCYEKFEKGNILPEVRESIKKYVRNQARFLKYLHVSWFGGEPLLAFDEIVELSEEFIKICEEFDIRFSASITTNGYLLTPDRAEKLLDLHVEHFQITLDGDAENHDQHRHLIGGQPTFERIWNNIVSLRDMDRNYVVRIRINFAQDNLPSIPNFVGKLTKNFANDNRFTVDFFPIGQWGGPNDEELPVLSEKAAFKSALSLCDMAVDNDLNNVLDNRLKPGGYVCYAAKPNSFVIGSDGMVYKCTVALYNEKNQIGQMQPDGTMKLDMDKYALWIMNDESEDAGCKTCFFRPACQGASCPLVRIEQHKAPCPPEKKNIQQVVKLVGKQMKKKAMQR